MERIKLKNVKYSARFSEETYAFQADIFFDNKKIGYCVNRGVGGSTDCNLWDGEVKTKEAFKKMEEYCNSLGIEGYGNKLEWVVDDLFQNWLTNQAIKKDEKKGILFGNTTKYTIQTFYSNGKRISIADIIKKGEEGIKVLKNFCSKIKEEGHTVLNTNLPFSV
jgi:hypothetical protein